jgi:tetratricopeptide (TPR) repeat protein
MNHARYLVAATMLCRLAAMLCMATLCLPAAVHAQQGGDVQAQILYAFQTEDDNSLRDLIQNLSNQVKADPKDLSLRYHLAHAQYRFGQLQKARRAGEAANAFSDCIDELKPAIDDTVKSAESMALQSACYSELADLKSMQAVLLRSRSADRLKAAEKLAPRNPRVLLLAATRELERAKPGSSDRQQAFVRLQLAAQLFDQTPATDIDAPGWGHAEAYLALGRELQSRGDRLGARNWTEKSLIAAPDYKAAQRQLSSMAKP